MSDTITTNGICTYCGRELSRVGMSRHLEACGKRKEAIAAADRKPGAEEVLVHLRVEDKWQKDYWLNLEMRGAAALGDLDDYLRAIWLECCGHLSAFSTKARSGEEIDMSRRIERVFRPGVELLHEYDFGTTSDTIVKAVAIRKGKPLGEHPIVLMARNQPPEFLCMECERPATRLCQECQFEYEESGFLCDLHAKEHPHEEYGELIEILNSPRLGMCGYTGPADPPY